MAELFLDDLRMHAFTEEQRSMCMASILVLLMLPVPAPGGKSGLDVSVAKWR